MDVESRLRNLEERLNKLDGNKTVTPKMNNDKQDEDFMDPMELKMRR